MGQRSKMIINSIGGRWKILRPAKGGISTPDTAEVISNTRKTDLIGFGNAEIGKIPAGCIGYIETDRSC